MNKYTINDITRASGGFAMLAVDQREAMRMMFAAAGAPAPVADSVLTDFKVNAAKALSPYASAILVDQQFCYRQVVEQNAIAKSCAMIVAADEFIPGNGIPVDSVVIDRKINPLQIKQDGGKALKLLVLWRSDEDAQQRLDMVKEFNELCHSHGLVSIIEPVVRPPRRGDKFDREQAIIDAAKELGDSGADLYKVEMPLYGKGPQQELLCASQRLNDHINMPWVILSSGPDYNKDNPAHRFRAFGGTPGHWIEWGRLMLHIHAALEARCEQPPAWLLEDAKGLFNATVRDAWAPDGADGIVYTVDWEGKPVVRERVRWPIVEAMGTAYALYTVTGDRQYETWYQTWWEYCIKYLMDYENGSWWQELDADNKVTTKVWDGKQDIYHLLHCLVIPRIPLAPGMAPAVAAGLLDINAK